MSDPKKSGRIPPKILERARELRREMTPQERKLWQRLRGKQLYGLKFRRQHPIHRYILDFYCHQVRLAVELDGHGHGRPRQQAYDQTRTDWLKRRGVQVIRFTNREVDSNMEGVLEEIARVCGVGAPPSNSPQGGENGVTDRRMENGIADQGVENGIADQGAENGVAERGATLPPAGGD